MTWITGTATDHLDLLATIKTNVEAHGWTTERYITSGEPSPYTAELIITGPGFGAGFPVFCGIRVNENTLNNIHSYECRGMTAYDSGQPFDFQPSVSPPAYCNLWDDAITYWMSVTDRRIIVIAKCSNTYHSLYMGFIAPFTDPTEYPYPEYIAADGPAMVPFGNTDYNQRAIANPGQGGAFIRGSNGVWNPVAVYDQNTTFQFSTYGTGKYTIYPYHTADFGTNLAGQFIIPTSCKFENNPGVGDGSLPMFPCYVQAMFDKGGWLGVLEGVFWTPGNSLSAEQVLTFDSENYLVFIDISRSTEQPTQFYCIKEA